MSAAALALASTTTVLLLTGGNELGERRHCLFLVGILIIKIWTTTGQSD